MGAGGPQPAGAVDHRHREDLPASTALHERRHAPRRDQWHRRRGGAVSDGSRGEVAVPHVLREYALLADGERGALVGPRGDICWLCFPGWDGDGLFASLIGGGGVYAVTPRQRFVWGGYYERPGLIWRGRWICDDGTVVECREALALPSSADRAVILRRILPLKGTARMRVLLDLRFDFGRRGARARHSDGRSEE